MNDTQSIPGWKPPTFFDVSTGERRIATQADMDRAEIMWNTLAQVRYQLRIIDDLFSQAQTACGALGRLNESDA